ncbi:MAG TPA: serine/threonine-protein kinase [Ktedonobacterales bacterium]
MSTHGGAGASDPFPVADRYRIQARVGLGGTAMVYRCVDLHTQRTVAVKVLRTNGPLIPEAATRFRREALLAARLSNPHIVRVLDFGYTIPPPMPSRTPWSDDGDQPVPYLAMEYVYGSTLKAIVRERGPLPLDWVWRVGEQICSALTAAHTAGVVHRDVKPQNVLVLDSRLELVAKLTDFGIARQIGSDLTTLTATGQVIGTPDYLSPEQVLGEPGGPASDLYALGVVLFELTTGRLPFEADTPLAAASRRMMVNPPPLTRFRPDVPPALQEVILLALRREQDERYASAEAFAQALRWSREQSPEVATAPGPRGGWVLSPRHKAGDRGVVELARDAASMRDPVGGGAGATGDAGGPEAEGEALQSTVLRVAPLAPGIEPPEVIADGAVSDAAPDNTPLGPGESVQG